MSWRLASRFAVVISVILVGILIFVITHGASASSEPTLQGGTDLGNTPAPDFRLTDQFGNPISLSQFHDHPVVLTFLYTHCPDHCPLVADKLHLTLEKLGSDSSKVNMLAVSTDPQNDDMASAYHFSDIHHLLNQWHFLVGSTSQLTPIWSAYHIYASAPTPTANGSDNVDHTVALYLIDKQGHERILLPEDFDPAVLASDLHILLNE